METDSIYCFPPWTMRQQAVKAVLSRTKRAILVLPVYDRVTAEYTHIFKHFEFLINIGQKHYMTMRVRYINSR